MIPRYTHLDAHPSCNTYLTDPANNFRTSPVPKNEDKLYILYTVCIHTPHVEHHYSDGFSATSKTCATKRVQLQYVTTGAQLHKAPTQRIEHVNELIMHMDI